MLDILKFDIGARNAAARAAFDQMKGDLRGIKGAVAGVNDYAMRAGRSMRNIGAGLTAGVTAPLGLLSRQMITLYDTQIKAEKAVAQAIQSTGGAAGRTLDQLKARASGLQGLTTFGDEDILRNVTAPLLTFTKIQGETFDRAQANVLDMATLLQTDLKSASILVGKALNDPIKGISALGRSGVQFSEDQKKVIKAMVETGNVAGAQALILQELETQFQGQAAAAANSPLGRIEQLKNSIGDLKEELGAEIAPFLKPLVDSVRNAVTWFGTLSPTVKRNIVVFGGLAAAVGPIVGMMGLAVIGVTQVGTALAGLATLALGHPIVLLLGAIAGGAALIYRNWDGISAWFSAKWGQVRAATAEKWEAIRAYVRGAYDSIKSKWEFIGTWFYGKWSQVRDYTKEIWEKVKGAVVGVYDAIVSKWTGFVEFFRGILDPVGRLFDTLLGKMNAVVRSGAEVQRLSEAPAGGFANVPGVFDHADQVGGAIAGGLAAGVSGGSGAVNGAVSGMADGAISTAKDGFGVQSPSRVFSEIGGFLMSGLKLGVEGGTGAVVQALEVTSDRALNVMSSLRDGAKRIFTDVLTGAGTFKSSLASVLGGFGSSLINSGVTGLFDAIWPNANGNVFSGGRVQAFAKGAVISGAMLFPMANGAGVMGEAGPEAIMPLERGSDGRLGVKSNGGGVMRVEVALTGLPEGVDVQTVERVASGVAVRVMGAGLTQYAQGFDARVEDYGERAG